MKKLEHLRARLWFQRAAAFFDAGAWVLILPCLLLWLHLDPLSIKTVVAWLLQFPILVGIVGIIVSRVLFPQIRLGVLYGKVVNENSIAAAILAGALMLSVALLVSAATGWAK